MTRHTDNTTPEQDNDPLYSRGGRPTVPGPFGALVEELSVRVHPAMAEQIFLKAARLRMDPSAYLRDIIYRHETGRSYSEHVADAIKSRNEAMFGKASERNRNEDVSDGSLPILRRVST